jgi:branched-chain amino acid transport system permease protein
MAIGAYAYGILMMSGGRPDNAAPIVGWLYDASPALQGAGIPGLLACLFAGLLAAALLLIPLLLTMESSARRAQAPGGMRRVLLSLALVVGGAALVWAGLAGHPAGKHAFPAGLLLSLTFAGFLAALAGALLLLRALVDLVTSRTPLARSRTGRAVVAGALALAVGVWVFVAGYPLGESGALAMGVLFAILIGMTVAALVAFLLGLPAIKLREDYLAIVTLGFAEILRNVILNEERWTRGAQPIQSFPRPVATWASDSAWWRDLASNGGVRGGDLALLVVSALLLAYAYVLLRALSESPWGRVLKAIREDEDATAALGKPVAWFKLQALMLGSAIAAVAGVLYVSQTALVSNGQFLPVVTFYAFIIIVMGGIGSHKGAIVGAVILWGIFFGAQNAGLENFGIEAGPAQLIVVGLVLIAVMMFRPQGLVGRREELLFAK